MAKNLTAKITKQYVKILDEKFVLIGDPSDSEQTKQIRGENKNHFNPYNLWQKKSL